MVDERGFDGELEGADGSGRAGDEVGEVGEGDGEPGSDAIDGYAEQTDRGDEDHAFAGPDDDGLEEKQQRFDNAETAGGVEGEGDPVLDLCEFGICGQAGEEALDGRLQDCGRRPEE